MCVRIQNQIMTDSEIVSGNGKAILSKTIPTRKHS